MKPMDLSGGDLKPADFYDVVLRRRPVRVSPRAIRKMARSRKVVERHLAGGDVIYGVTTGFGKLADQRISADEIKALQVNLLRSHACGFGPPLSEVETRGMILLRAHVHWPPSCRGS